MTDWGAVWAGVAIGLAVVGTIACVIAEPCGVGELVVGVAAAGEAAAATIAIPTVVGGAAAIGPAILGGALGGISAYAWQNTDNGSDSGSDCADDIANGHAYDDHNSEFPGVQSQSEFAEVVRDVMKNGISRDLERGRTAFFDEGRVVILDPRSSDGGSMFRASFDYFLGLD